MPLLRPKSLYWYLNTVLFYSEKKNKMLQYHTTSVECIGSSYIFVLLQVAPVPLWRCSSPGRNLSPGSNPESSHEERDAGSHWIIEHAPTIIVMDLFDHRCDNSVGTESMTLTLFREIVSL